MMQAAGKALVLFGAVLVAVGAALYFVHDIPILGRLPGDIDIRRDNFRIFFPITTSILLSVLLTLVLWVVSWLRGK